MNETVKITFLLSALFAVDTEKGVCTYGGREGQVALEPCAQLANLLFNYRTNGQGTKSRNRNNKELICLILVQF